MGHGKNGKSANHGSRAHPSGHPRREEKGRSGGGDHILQPQWPARCDLPVGGTVKYERQFALREASLKIDP